MGFFLWVATQSRALKDAWWKMVQSAEVTPSAPPAELSEAKGLNYAGPDLSEVVAELPRVANVSDG